jgi:large subunit ribosomal protein L31
VQYIGLDLLATDVYNRHLTMKKDLHPTNYRPVVFQDLNDNTTFLTKSTVETEETIKLDGVEYPLVKVHISSASHPFFTGQEKLVDIEGRVDKFKARQEAAKARSEAMKKSAGKTREKTAKSDETQKIGTLKTSKN